MASKVGRVLTGALTVALVGTVGYLNVPRHASASPPREPRWYDQFRDRPTVSIHGTLWDFYKKNRREMDPDFDDHGPKGPKGEYCDVMKHELDGDGKPVFSGGGYRVETTWNDIQKRPIIWPKSYIDLWPGDQAGKSPHKEHHEKDDAVTPEEDVVHWFRDDPGTNETYDAPITFTRTFAPDGPPPFPPPHPPKHGQPAPTGPQAIYVFDSLIPKGKKIKGEHHPKKDDDILAMIAEGKAKKKRYTFEGETTFIFEAGTPIAESADDPPAPPKDDDDDKPKKKDDKTPATPPLAKSGYWLTVQSQDDVWVYIDGKLVIDLGGAYKGKEKKPFGTQTIELDRLGWLNDGDTCTLKIFMADRDKHSEKSHLKVMTNIPTLNLVGPNAAHVEFD